jgi:hypothetical protein
MATIGGFIGALLITYLLSRLFLWFLKSWDGGTRRTILVHVISLILCGFLGGLGFANNGAFAGVHALEIYAVPQLIWLVTDLVRAKLRRRDAGQSLASVKS